MSKRISVAALAVATLACAPNIRAAQQYEVLDRISGPSWVTAWDYAKIGPGANYLYLAAIGSESSVIRVDLRSKRVGEWVSDKMPHGIAFVGDGVVAVADATTNTVVFAEEASGKRVGLVETGKPPTASGWHNPDALLVEPKTGLLIAMNEDSGALVLVDVSKHVLVGTIQVGGSLEAAAARDDGTVYVNMEDKHTIAVVDVPARRVVRKLPLKNRESPTGIAYDSSNDLVVSICENGLAKFVDPGTGREVASLKVALGADDVIYDRRRKMVFIPGGDDGKLSISNLYLPTSKPDLAAPPLRLPGLPPIPPAAPGSFEFLVVGIRP